jgi:O-acetyl-ADP-ribose deacetylase (regulator of RNase III)
MSLGPRVHDYEVWGRLGEGGMSEVWLAKHTVLNVPVVMKTLKGQALGIGADGCAQRVFNEARLMARVTSGRVVRVIDAGVHDDGEKTPYLVEEYVDGIDLAELDRRRRRALGVGLPLWFVCHVMHELCEGLRAAHHVGVLHRDLKPSNVFTAPGSGIRLGDFGLAVARAEATTGDASGTLRFMAPEQLRGEALTRACDVYGAGATACDLRYGSPPFLDVESALDPNIAPRFAVPQSAPEAYFQHVIGEMLRKRAEDRPSDTCEPSRSFLTLANTLRPMRARSSYTPLGHDSFAIGEVHVTLAVGDIALEEADAIVSSATDDMRMRSGVGEALRLRGGDVIEEEGLRGGRQPLGACVATDAGTLRARHVLHAVSAWNEASCIGRAMDRSLLLAEELGLRTLAFPALGTGAARVNMETCARAMTAGIAGYLALGGSHLRQVRIVLASEEKLRIFRDVFDDVMRDGADDPPADFGLPDEGVTVRVDAATHLDPRTKH